MIDDNHHRILQAATRVYAQHGWRGATTRRIAEEAGVNEVTLFRHFGSKDALLDAAILRSASEDAMQLPTEPAQPEAELHEWAKAQHEKISRKRAFVRQLMSDAFDRPDAAACVGRGPNLAVVQLREYVVHLRRTGWISDVNPIQPAEVGAASTMLIGAVFSDAMNRDLMPDMFPQPKDDTLLAYVRIFLRGLGALPQPLRPATRTERVVSTSSSAIPE
jgi:AcrR family transcriptional regulator